MRTDSPRTSETTPMHGDPMTDPTRDALRHCPGCIDNEGPDQVEIGYECPGAALVTPDPAPDVAQDGGLDVETLARAMTEAAPARVGIYAEAEAIAAEYARLRDTPSQPKETK